MPERCGNGLAPAVWRVDRRESVVVPNTYGYVPKQQSAITQQQSATKPNFVAWVRCAGQLLAVSTAVELGNVRHDRAADKRCVSIRIPVEGSSDSPNHGKC